MKSCSSAFDIILFGKLSPCQKSFFFFVFFFFFFCLSKYVFADVLDKYVKEYEKYFLQEIVFLP